MKEKQKKPMTWTDIEVMLKNSIENAPGETDEEKLAYFKKKIHGHLDNLQAEEEKKIVLFPKKKPGKEKE